ncbi:DUF4276 family protein [Streptomyces sp. NPDC003401]
MTRYLTMGLLAEGPEDEMFLSALAVRQLTRLAASAPAPFDVADTVQSSAVGTARTAHPRLCAEAQDLATTCDLLLVHNDHRERGKIGKLRRDVSPPSDCRIVGIVPVRETEAWLLVDTRLLRSLPGAVPAALPWAGEPSGAQVERVADPKALLADVLPGHDTHLLAELLGQRIDLDRLQALPAYQQWCAELTSALKELHFL